MPHAIVYPLSRSHSRKGRTVPCLPPWHRYPPLHRGQLPSRPSSPGDCSGGLTPSAVLHDVPGAGPVSRTSEASQRLREDPRAVAGRVYPVAYLAEAIIVSSGWLDTCRRGVLHRSSRVIPHMDRTDPECGSWHENCMYLEWHENCLYCKQLLCHSKRHAISVPFENASNFYARGSDPFLYNFQ